jgi:hypothetical protein
METNLADITATEEASVKDFEALMAATENDIDAHASTSSLMQDSWRFFCMTNTECKGRWGTMMFGIVCCLIVFF